MSISKIILHFLIFFSLKSFAQSPIELITEQKGVSLRGLSIPSESEYGYCNIFRCDFI